VKLYFDECCSRKLAKEIKDRFLGDHSDLETTHVLDFYDRATAESTWLQPLNEDRAWIAITNDHGRNSKKEKFHTVCKTLGITYVVLTPALISAGYKEHYNALCAVWDDLLKLHTLPPGSRVSLGFDDSKTDVRTYVLRMGQKKVRFPTS
jgi:hypothetical protein